MVFARLTLDISLRYIFYMENAGCFARVRCAHQCSDCGYELLDCICAGNFSQTHGLLPAPDCESCGDALGWCDDGWRCARCDVELEAAS